MTDTDWWTDTSSHSTKRSVSPDFSSQATSDKYQISLSNRNEGFKLLRASKQGREADQKAHEIHGNVGWTG
jgi:hypothetical protein